MEMWRRASVWKEPVVLLHDHPDFEGLLSLVASERGMDPVLVEKDYWIMHCLWGLQQQGFHFELKGGTSLSKGFGVIHRFSEDIDLRIEPGFYPDFTDTPEKAYA